jgi:hypothetical protein
MNIFHKFFVFKCWTIEKVQNLNDNIVVIILMYSEMYQILNLVQRPAIIIIIFLFFFQSLLENSGEVFYITTFSSLPLHSFFTTFSNTTLLWSEINFSPSFSLSPIQYPPTSNRYSSIPCLRRLSPA